MRFPLAALEEVEAEGLSMLSLGSLFRFKLIPYKAIQTIARVEDRSIKEVVADI
jgi:hypothetical protein